jgi:hypothetical protein
MRRILATSLSPKSSLFGLFPLVRQYSNSNSHSPHEIEKAEKIAKDVFAEFEAHKARNHELFKYLSKESQTGFSPEQFKLIRDNFFRRTRNTVVSVANHVAKAVEAGDYNALAKVGQNFADESGRGDPSAVHLRLLEDCYNTHGKTVFNLNPIKIKDADTSDDILRKTVEFGETQKWLFGSSYQRMTGCLLAHEGAADDMLENFRKSLFNPYSGYYTEKQFKDLMRYFDAHRDDSKEGGDVEAEHQRQALAIATSMIAENQKSEREIRDGGLTFLDAQSNLWTQLMEELTKRKSNKVAPREGWLEENKDVKSPTPILSNATGNELAQQKKGRKT